MCGPSFAALVQVLYEQFVSGTMGHRWAPRLPAVNAMRRGFGLPPAASPMALLEPMRVVLVACPQAFDAAMPNLLKNVRKVTVTSRWAADHTRGLLIASASAHEDGIGIEPAGDPIVSSAQAAMKPETHSAARPWNSPWNKKPSRNPLTISHAGRSADEIARRH